MWATSSPIKDVEQLFEIGNMFEEILGKRPQLSRWASHQITVLQTIKIRSIGKYLLQFLKIYILTFATICDKISFAGNLH